MYTPLSDSQVSDLLAVLNALLGKMHHELGGEYEYELSFLISGFAKIGADVMLHDLYNKQYGFGGQPAEIIDSIRENIEDLGNVHQFLLRLEEEENKDVFCDEEEVPAEGCFGCPDFDECYPNYNGNGHGKAND
jgi:hypothetical protein